jgi:hypothetical protein
MLVAFKIDFVGAPNARNPIDQFETNRLGNLVVNAKIVDLMNSKTDPRTFILLNAVRFWFVCWAVSGAPGTGNYSKFTPI